MKKFVNGPINSVRIEGQIGNINKVLYVFFDIHVPESFQTECVDFRAMEFKDYLIKNFDLATKNKVNVDFFLEMYTIYGAFDERFSGEVLKQRRSYLANLRKFFKQNFNFDKEANKIHESKDFPKTRLHYIDFRDLFIYDIIFGKLPQINNYFDNYLWNNKNILEQDIHFFRNEISYIDQRMVFLKGYIYEGKKIKGEKDAVLMMFEKIINKILNVYENKEVKQVLRKYFLDNFIKYFNKYDDNIRNLLDQLEFLEKVVVENKNKLNEENEYGINFTKLMTQYLPNLWKALDKLELVLLHMSAFIIDIYFLRRFLDKKYISNSLIYTGGAHSCNYLFFLIKYFGFKITNSSYQRKPSKDIVSLINKTNDYVDLKQMFYPQELYQCSDLTDFPDSFL